MAVKANTYPINFRVEEDYREMMAKIGQTYGTRNMTKVLKTLIEKEYNAQIINPQENTKEV